MSTRRCTRVVSLKLLPLDSLPAEMMRGRRQYPRMLVYEPIPPVCQPLREPIYSAPGVAMGVTIKVCNYSRMCQACRPPPLCDCKPIAPPLPSGKRLLKKICSLSKLAIFLVAVKWLFDVGIFGDQRKAMKIMKGIKDQMRKFFNTKRACVQSDAAVSTTSICTSISLDFHPFWRLTSSLAKKGLFLLENFFLTNVASPMTFSCLVDL